MRRGSRRRTLSDAQIRFAAAELGVAMKGDPPSCSRCGDNRFVVNGPDIDACPDCGKRAEAEWRDLHE